MAGVRISGSEWGQIGAWNWTGGGPQVPGALTDVTLGEYGSVGSLCEARCATLDVPAGSTLLVPVDLTQPLAAQDHSIDVGGLAKLKGRVWLLASGGSVLPADLHVPVVSAGSYDGYFSILQTTVPAPPGKFLALVPAATSGGPGWALALRDLPSSLTSGSGTTGAVAGTAVAAEAMDFDGDGDDDLAIAIDNGAGSPGTLQVLLNDGQGNLGLVSYLRQTQPRPTALAVGDLNGDGRTDAVVGTAPDQSAQAFLNAFPQTSPPFAAGTQYAVGATPTALTVLDPPDPLVVVGASDAVVRFFAPALSAAVQQTTVPRPTVSIDKRDRRIVSGGPNPSTFGGTLLNGMLVVLTPDPVTGLYPASVSTGIGVPGIPVNMDVADIDRDGIADVMTANADPQQLASGTALGVLTLFKGTATGFEQPVPIAPAGATAGLDVAMADLNADGVRDIVSVHQTVVGQSAAAVVLVNQDQPGGPLTLGTQQPIEATRPILCPRGQLRGAGAADEGVFIVESGGGGSFDGEGGSEGGSSLALPNPAPRAIPVRAQCLGDLDGDGRVSGIDLGALLGEWGMTGAALRADLDGDGRVSGADLGILVGAWGNCGE
jgi:hypothetical protein